MVVRRREESEQQWDEEAISGSKAGIDAIIIAGIVNPKKFEEERDESYRKRKGG